MSIEQVMNLPLSQDDRQIVQSIQQQLAKKEVVIGLFGSFSVGKSKLINRLTGNPDLLPTHTNETTALPTFIQGGSKEQITALGMDGKEEALDKAALHELTAGGKVDKYKEIHIELTAPDWLHHVHFIDTPGRNTKFQSHLESSHEAILNSDAALYVMPWQGLTMEDVVYVKQLLLYQPNLVFVINKVDRIEEAEGITVEELKKTVIKDLTEQFGKEYPVFAVSAETGYNIDLLHTDYILQVFNNMEMLKQKRFTYAMGELVKRQKKIFENEIAILEMGMLKDNSSIDDEKRKIELQYKHVDNQLTEELQQMKRLLTDQELNMNQVVKEEIDFLQERMEVFLGKQTDFSVDEVQLHLENLIVTSRQEIYDKLTNLLRKVVNHDANFKLNQPEGEHSTLNYTEVSLEELTERFDRKKQQLIKQMEEKSNQFKNLPEKNTEEERKKLKEELESLSQQAVEEYVPHYIVDETFDPRKMEKILRGVGFVGDIALAVSLAAVTAGASAGAQVGGKAAAKAATKKAMKEAAIKAGKEKLQHEIVEKGMRLALESGNSHDNTQIVVDPSTSKVELEKMKKGQQSPLMTTVKTLDAITSPIETLAVNIGRSIDGNRQASTIEDEAHRQKYAEKIYKVKMRAAERQRELKKLEKDDKASEALRLQIEKKAQFIKQETESQLEKIEREQKETLQHQKQVHFAQQISSQICEVLNGERVHYNQWVKSEFERIYQTVETMLPDHYYNELTAFKEKLAEVEEMKEKSAEDLQFKLKEMETHLETCESILSTSNATHSA